MACDPSRFCYDWEEVTTVLAYQGSLQFWSE